MSFDPFKIDGPTCFSLSGGRTSAYMLHRTLESNGGLPNGTLILFCNTGKEDEMTLRFVRDIGERWKVPIIWLEYRYSRKAFVQDFAELIIASADPNLADTISLDPLFKVVNFETASCGGEPFEAIIRQRGGILPNPRSRYCSSEMKTRTMHRYLRSIGWTEWETFIGIRADESRRAAKFRFNPHPETKSEYVRVPLVDAHVTVQDVGAFWQIQPFDLGLRNIGGKAMDGNCDLCFLKPARQIFSLAAAKPERTVWWAKQEKSAESVAKGNGCRFRDDRPSYTQIAKYVEQQTDLFDPDEEAISCLCGD